MSKIESMERLINALTFLPGVGKKTAERYAYAIINLNEDDVNLFAKALIDAKKNLKFCEVCGNFTEEDVCSICKERKHNVICVVKEPRDVLTIEKAKVYHGVYHVLHGTINPLENKGPNDIRIKELLERVNKEEVQEVIMATNPDVEGEVTANYIAKILKPLGVKVTRLAQGIQMGSDLQYADEVTLSKAINDRTSLWFLY